MNSYNIDYDFIFGILDRAIDAENHVDDNHVPEVSKHSNDSTVTREEDDTHSTSTSRVNVLRVSVLTDDQVEGEHLSSTLHGDNQYSTVEGEHVQTASQVEGEHVMDHADVEGEHKNSNPLVEGEPSGSSHDEGNDQDNDFHDITDNISIAGDVSDDEIFEKAPSEFDST